MTTIFVPVSVLQHCLKTKQGLVSFPASSSFCLSYIYIYILRSKDVTSYILLSIYVLDRLAVKIYLPLGNAININLKSHRLTVEMHNLVILLDVVYLARMRAIKLALLECQIIPLTCKT